MDADNADDLMEKEADHFAINLIMPSAFVERLHPHYSVSYMAKMFSVSRTMMERRLIGDL